MGIEVLKIFYHQKRAKIYNLNILQQKQSFVLWPRPGIHTRNSFDVSPEDPRSFQV